MPPVSLMGWLGKKPPVDQPVATKSGATAPADFGDYRIVERADGRFNVVGSRGAITTRKTRELAEECALQFVQNGAPPPSKPTAQPPTRVSSRVRQSSASSAAPETSAPKSNAGRPPGSKNKKRKEVEAVQPEHALLDYVDAHPAEKRTKLGQLSVDCALSLKQLRVDAAELQKKYDQARALLAAELGYESNEPLRRSEIAELIGTGYDDLKGRTIRWHKQNVLAEIRLQVFATWAAAVTLPALHFAICAYAEPLHLCS